jgi:hypothetical protein
MGSRLLSLGGDNAALDEWGDQLVAIATERGFPYYRALGSIYRGWVEVKKWQCGGGAIAAAQRVDCFPRHRGGGVDALSYRPPCQGM